VVFDEGNVVFVVVLDDIYGLFPFANYDLVDDGLELCWFDVVDLLVVVDDVVEFDCEGPAA
jgi:hypothetical protein